MQIQVMVSMLVGFFHRYEWRRFVSSLSTDESIHVFDRGIATNNPNDCLLSVGSNDGLFCVDLMVLALAEQQMDIVKCF